MLIIYIAILNTSTNIDINYVKSYFFSMDFDNPFLSKTLKLSVYTLIIFGCGILSGLGILSLFLGIQKDKVKAYKRELEKNVVSGESNSAKVNVLEAKIKTLEKAFESVTDERTKLELQIKQLNAEIENMNNQK
jgi:septal ring factor EnvC (AmiA/AmiB activator)